MKNDNFLTLYFANDLLVITDDEEDLEYMIRKLKETYNEVGLQVNVEKSEYFIVCKVTVTKLPLQKSQIKGFIFVQEVSIANEMDFSRKYCRKTRLDKISNTTIREIMEVNKVNNSIKVIFVYGLASRMEEVRWSKKILAWIPQGRWKWWKWPRHGWKDETAVTMKQRGLNEGD